jgi:hypothetical protein
MNQSSFGKLKWHEPNQYRRAQLKEYESNNPWNAIKFFATAFLIILGLRFLAGLGAPNPNLPSWEATLGIAFISALVLAFIFPILISRIAISIVILSEKGVNNNIIGHGASLYYWPWEQVAYCSMGTIELHDKSYRTLSLHDESDSILATFGIPEKPTEVEIQECLRLYGKHMKK